MFKDFKDNKLLELEEKNNVWNSEKIAEVAEKIKLGIEVRNSPFFIKNRYEWRKGNIVYEYSKNELDTLSYCSEDILNFADNFTYLLTENGYTKITPRPYQRKILKAYELEKNVIILSSRQVGKCVDFFTKITVKRSGLVKTITIGELYYESLKRERKLKWHEKIKYFLYKLLK